MRSSRTLSLLELRRRSVVINRKVWKKILEQTLAHRGLSYINEKKN